MSEIYTEKDLIGRKNIVDKIGYLIDKLPKDENFCLSLNGEWGSGKSYVMNMLCERLEKSKEYIVIHYDAWKNNFYSDPLIAILYCILDELNRYSEDITQDKSTKTAKEAAKEVCAAVVDTLCEKSKIFAIAVKGIKAIIKACKNAELTNGKEFCEYKSYLTLLNETIKILNDITAYELYGGKQTKFVVLVDEIDRCLPNEQLLVLERLHHIFAVNNCAVVVALNKKAIIANFELNYGGDGNEYLRKFFNYNFSIETNELVFLTSCLKNIFDDINEKRERPIFEKSIDFIIKDIVNTTKDIVTINDIDNRDIIKYVRDSKHVLNNMIEWHSVMIWFALRLNLYKLFGEKQYRLIRDDAKKNDYPFMDLQEFNGKDLEIVGYNDYNEYSDYSGTDLNCAVYNDKKYNKLLALFNLCKFRNSSYRIVLLGNIFYNDLCDLSEDTEGDGIDNIIENIKSVIHEIDRFGDR